MSETIISQVLEQLRMMPDKLQHEVLIFTRQLKASTQAGMPGKNLLQFAGAISLEDLSVMQQAIETDCEQVDLNEW
jgi:hypothetical protein